jgi:mRNA-degrading endonuclease RelE of RelBE toxin-antitoxin system
MHIEATITFIKLYKKLDPELKTQVKKALTLLQHSPEHPSLGHKKMTGHKDIYEIRVTKNFRITYTKTGDTAILRKVGTHDILNNP